MSSLCGRKGCVDIKSAAAIALRMCRRHGAAGVSRMTRRVVPADGMIGVCDQAQDGRASVKARQNRQGRLRLYCLGPSIDWGIMPL